MAVGNFFVVAVLWLGGVFAAIAGGVLLAKRRGIAGGSLLAVGLLVVMAPFAAIAYFISPLSNPTTIRVDGLDPPHDPELTVELRHARDFDDGTEYHFGQAGSPQRVVSVFQDQHPNGVVSLVDGAQPRVGESIWHLSTEDVRYDLVYLEQGDWYALATQVVVLHPSAAGQDLRIPFPRSALDATEVREGQRYVNGWSWEDWVDFYGDISEVRIEGNTITVPSAQGPTAKLSVDDGITTIAIND